MPPMALFIRRAAPICSRLLRLLMFAPCARFGLCSRPLSFGMRVLYRYRALVHGKTPQYSTNFAQIAPNRAVLRNMPESPCIAMQCAAIRHVCVEMRNVADCVGVCMSGMYNRCITTILLLEPICRIVHVRCRKQHFR